MKKTFPLTTEGKNRDRTVDATKHEIRKYVQRERRRALPEGVDFLDFDCRIGRDADSAETVHLAQINKSIDALVAQDAPHFYLEVLAKPGHRRTRPAAEEGELSNPPATDADSVTTSTETPARPGA